MKKLRQMLINWDKKFKYDIEIEKDSDNIILRLVNGHCVYTFLNELNNLDYNILGIYAVESKLYIVISKTKIITMEEELKLIGAKE